MAAGEDKREKILVRLMAILAGIPEFGGRVFRNRGSLDDDQKPGCVMLDGSEKLKLAPLYDLLPQIFVLLKPRDNRDNLLLAGADKPIGPELSEYRIKVIRAILHDELLKGLLGSNGRIDILGSGTDMQTGSTMEGMLRIDPSLTYVFDTRQL